MLQMNLLKEEKNKYNAISDCQLDGDNLRNEYIIYGYLRDIDNILPSQSTIPPLIFHLCLSFYSNDFLKCIVYLDGNGEPKQLKDIKKSIKKFKKYNPIRRRIFLLIAVIMIGLIIFGSFSEIKDKEDKDDSDECTWCILLIIFTSVACVMSVGYIIWTYTANLNLRFATQERRALLFESV